MTRPLLLDLFCCEGGAALGYHRAGFDIIGVDIDPQPRYPFPFIQADALEPPIDWVTVSAVHASPPCQQWAAGHNPNRHDYPDLVAATRELLQLLKKPYVIENVRNAPLRASLMLCGSMFDHRTSQGFNVQRHRYFEIGGWSLPALTGLPECNHDGMSLSVTGTGTPTGTLTKLGRTVRVDEYREVMDMPWASRHGLSEAIPPVYTEWIGEQLLPFAVTGDEPDESVVVAPN